LITPYGPVGVARAAPAGTTQPQGRVYRMELEKSETACNPCAELIWCLINQNQKGGVPKGI
jgi:hypothetical protein